jgi:signal transduction histidine kinase
VSTKKVRLGKTLRDFSFPRDASSEQAESSEHEIILKRGSECEMIEISDTGCGIDPLQVARIFDPFFTTKPYGTGLGLPMVKRTINSHGGVVTVKSKKDRGTTFSLYFPLDRRM